jgi:DNA-binding MarR family transcriptional regulator
MEAATANSLGITLKGLADTTRLPEESVKVHLDDLVALQIIDRHHGQYDKKFVYKMREDYRQLMSKFEGIEMVDKLLDKEEEFVPPPTEDSGVPIDQIPAGLFQN